MIIVFSRKSELVLNFNENVFVDDRWKDMTVKGSTMGEGIQVDDSEANLNL